MNTERFEVASMPMIKIAGDRKTGSAPGCDLPKPKPPTGGGTTK